MYMTLTRESKTAKNLMRAFAGESQARNRYTFAASVAQKKQSSPSGTDVFFIPRDRKKNMQSYFTRRFLRWMGRPLKLTVDIPPIFRRKF